jgi:AcrR family transcriptional regulator
VLGKKLAFSLQFLFWTSTQFEPWHTVNPKQAVESSSLIPLISVQNSLYDSIMTISKPRYDAKQRLIEAADRLFYAEGSRAVGIDRVITESGVAKMTLYTHYRSKDDLILAVLQHREHVFTSSLLELIKLHDASTHDRLNSFFLSLKDWFESPGFRGCAFINAAIETPNPNHSTAIFVREAKRRFASLLQSQIELAIGAEASQITPAISLLVEGAIVTAVIENSPNAAEIAHHAARLLVEAWLAK